MASTRSSQRCSLSPVGPAIRAVRRPVSMADTRWPDSSWTAWLQQWHFAASGFTHLTGPSAVLVGIALVVGTCALLRRAGTQHHLPRGLLHRASLWRVKLQITKDISQIGLAERDLSETETIAERGSMLRWQIEVALERTRLALCRAKSQIPNGKSQMEIACSKLEEAEDLVKQTEKPYEPHVPDWEEWEPPKYVGVFKKGDIVGYHCRNDEIERLQKQIDSLK